MAKYLVQKMSSGSLNPITYYRKQSAHPSHTETGAFTSAAILAYATTNNIPVRDVEKGSYSSGQGIPTGGTCIEI